MIRARRGKIDVAASDDDGEQKKDNDDNNNDNTSLSLPPSGAKAPAAPARIKMRTKRRRFLLIVLTTIVLSSMMMLHQIIQQQQQLQGPYNRNNSTFLKLCITILRTIIFPLLRPKCLPSGKLPTNSSTLKFAITTMFLPQNGPDHWKPQMKELLHLSNTNKLKYCSMHDNYQFINGTKWAEENYNRTLKKIQGRERGVWFKPFYINQLLTNLSSTEEDSNPNHADWILYTDTDTMIINYNFQLTNLLAGVQPNHGMIVSSDAEGFNAGVLMIRNNYFGKMIMNVWGGERTIYNFSTKTTDQSFLEGMFDKEGYLLDKYFTPLMENAATHNATNNNNNNSNKDYNNHHRPRIKVVHQCALQSGGGLESRSSRDKKKYPKWLSWWPYFEGTYARGDFLVHFFGRPDKLEQMKIAEEGSLGFWSR